MKELRCGNLISSGRGIYRVYALCKTEILAIQSIKEPINSEEGLIDATPAILSQIPLTEEWLIKFGFEEIKSNSMIPSYTKSIAWYKGFKVLSVYIQFGNQYVYIRDGELMADRTDDHLVTIYNQDIHGPLTVNYLQNIYYYLTGSELEY